MGHKHRAARLMIALGCTLTARVGWTGTVPVVGTISWTSADGKQGSTQFQGTVDDAGQLSGEVKAGDLEVPVHALLDANGQLSGSVWDPDGSSAIASFSASLGQGTCSGTYAVAGGGAGSWSAPADALPLPGAASTTAVPEN